jgi:hypothetical protein
MADRNPGTEFGNCKCLKLDEQKIYSSNINWHSDISHKYNDWCIRKWHDTEFDELNWPIYFWRFWPSFETCKLLLNSNNNYIHFFGVKSKLNYSSNLWCFPTIEIACRVNSLKLDIYWCHHWGQYDLSGFYYWGSVVVVNVW